MIFAFINLFQGLIILLKKTWTNLKCNFQGFVCKKIVKEQGCSNNCICLHKRISTKLSFVLVTFIYFWIEKIKCKSGTCYLNCDISFFVFLKILNKAGSPTSNKLIIWQWSENERNWIYSIVWCKLRIYCIVLCDGRISNCVQQFLEF